jgi:NAD(P)-dependent dehydrogenase (short-subunit alcohol dehydrogenase family)
MSRLNGKVALVMGGGSDGPPAPGEKLAIGNGRAIAIECAREGAAVMVADRNFSAAEDTAQAIRAQGHRAKAVACDLLIAANCENAVRETVTAFGAVHLLVNNAAITDFTSVVDTPDEEFEQVMRVNVRGYFLAIKYAVPEMARHGGGAVVNISSLAALRSGAGSGIAYDTSKAALLGLTRNAAVTAAAQKVRVNTVLPGIINSTILRRYLGDREIDFAARIPAGRMGTPWEIAKAVVFLLSDDASYITGTELLVDGGAAAFL